MLFALLQNTGGPDYSHQNTAVKRVASDVKCNTPRAL